MVDKKRVFQQGDKLDEALKWDSNLINRLIMLNPVFTGLKKLGKSEEGLEGLTLVAAAQLAEVAPDAFVSFVNCGNDSNTAPDKGETSRPQWIDGLTEETAEVVLDVRPIVKNGDDPLGRIMEALRPLNPESRVVLDAPFDPAPLKSVLGGMGFKSFAEQISAEHWRIYFRREYVMQNDVKKIDKDISGHASLGTADIDVRGLEPPQPLVTILKRLHSADVGDELTVLIHREPIYLAPELNDIGWTFEVEASAPDGKGGEEFFLRLRKEYN
ncbi:MAG: DUF2249 domain-containing protein [Alphaproteobacteria bacterium]|nr:DUF2249 domain-containing protein [Rhodospirillales bacterium]MCW9045556.1 DUF2249 domain-containing protein [Alphaproteobacteria bacterium]